jgi:hypothetical protein
MRSFDKHFVLVTKSSLNQEYPRTVAESYSSYSGNWTCLTRNVLGDLCVSRDKQPKAFKSREGAEKFRASRHPECVVVQIGPTTDEIVDRVSYLIRGRKVPSDVLREILGNGLTAEPNIS